MHLWLQQIRAVTNSRATYGYRRVWEMVNRTFRTGYSAPGDAEDLADGGHRVAGHRSDSLRPDGFFYHLLGGVQDLDLHATERALELPDLGVGVTKVTGRPTSS